MDRFSEIAEIVVRALFTTPYVASFVSAGLLLSIILGGLRHTFHSSLSLGFVLLPLGFALGLLVGVVLEHE